MVEIDKFYISEDLFITKILTILPIKSLLRFKCVNKRFNSIISSQYFARLLLKKSTLSNINQYLLINHKTCFLSFDFESSEGTNNFDCSPFNDEGDIIGDKVGSARVIHSNFHVPHCKIFVVGSCDGLVCLKTKFCFLYVWNPTTLERRKVSFHTQYKKQDVVCGFHYVASVNDYRVVRICQTNNEKTIQVFSLSANSWAFSKDELKECGENPRLTGLGVSVNDTTYWLCKGYQALANIREFRWWIISFNWISMKLNSVPNPNEQIGGFVSPPLMYTKDGCLCACWRTSDTHTIEVGMLKGSSWMKLHEISQYNVVRSMNFRHQGMPNITYKNRFALKACHVMNTLLLVDAAEVPPNDVHTLRTPASRNVVTYTESLISPFIHCSQDISRSSEK